jgi:uncharacterized protein (DUF58 family)
MTAAALTPESPIAEARSRGRVAFGLTPRALLLLLAGVLFLAPAFFIHGFVWGMLAWDVLMLLLIVRDFFQLPSPVLLHLERTWLTIPSQGVDAEVEIALEQKGTVLLHCRLVDDLPPALAVAPAELQLTAYPHQRVTGRYRFKPKQRGDHMAGKLFVRYRSGAGLVERWAVADLTQEVRVYPYRHPGEDADLFLARMKQIEQQLRRQRIRGLGRDFESLRDYREGDDLRDVCWTATARRGSLVTRQYQVEKSQPVWIVMDAGRLLQAEVGNGTKLDYSASTSLALARLALAGGDRVGLLAYGQQIQQRVGLGRGSTHLRQLMEAMAMVANEPSEADHLRATVTLNRMQSRRSLVLWITDLAETAMRPEVIDGATQVMRRHLLLFVIMRQDELVAIAAEGPKNAEQMYRRAAAQELLHRRETLLAKLRERGALTLETTPREMTTAVLNRYLEVKERAMI